MKALVNKGKRRLGVPGRPAIILNPGESVPIDDAQIKELHKNRTIERWLERGVLKICDESDVEKTPKKTVPQTRPAKNIPRVGRRNDNREPQVLPKGVKGEGVELHHKGGGWYEVFVNGFVVTDSNVRKADAEQIATEYE